MTQSGHTEIYTFTMTLAREIPWPRILAEGAAIVVSILLAFSIEAWWEERQERTIAQDILEAVLEDFKEGQSTVEFYKKMSTARMQSADELLMASKGGAARITEKEIDRLMADLSFFSDAEVINDGSIDALINSGTIGIITSKRLRQLIAGWPAFLDYARNNVKPDYDFQLEIWIPYIKDRGNVSQILRAVAHIPGHPDSTDWQQTVTLAGEPASHLKLLKDSEFLNIVAISRMFMFNNLDTYDDLEKRLVESIHLIESELRQLAH